MNDDDSPILQIITCGGGDAADAGRIRLAQTHHVQGDVLFEERYIKASLLSVVVVVPLKIIISLLVLNFISFRFF